MLRIIRKHNKWLMVAFGILLMIAFTAPEMIQRLGHAAANRTIATVNGKKLKQADLGRAHQDLLALERIAPNLIYGIGIQPRDHIHWILLTQEAEAAGFVGGPADGREFLPELAQMAARWELQRLQQVDVQQWFQFVLPHGSEEAAIRALAVQIEEVAPRFFADAHMNETEMHESLARLRGIWRLVMTHDRAARFSDRLAIVEARQAQDSALIDFIFIPAADGVDEIPDPTPEALQSHFEEFSNTAPGQGTYGIGYLLPPRIHLEWLKVDRNAIEEAVQLDPVEVVKRHRQQSSRYPGDFAEVRARIESDMRAEIVERSLQAAHSAIQAEVLAATRRLEQDGRFRRLPENWDEIRPRMEHLAATIVTAVGQDGGPSISLPAVQRRTDNWVTRSDLRQIEDLAQTFVTRGERRFSAVDVLFAARELGDGASGAPIPVQTGIPLVDNVLTDWAGNRYYVTVLAARGESPPDSVDEVREQAIADYKRLAAHRRLKERAESLREQAIAGDLDAIPAVIARPGREAPRIQKGIRVYRDRIDGAAADINHADVRKAIVEAAAKIDPFATAETIPPQDATLAIPSDPSLGLAIVRIRAMAPLTQEDYRRTERTMINMAQMREMREALGDESPFSIAALLRRHNYVSGKVRILTPEELRRGDDWEFDEGL